jgi:hypothetical protein
MTDTAAERARPGITEREADIRREHKHADLSTYYEKEIHDLLGLLDERRDEIARLRESWDAALRAAEAGATERAAKIQMNAWGWMRCHDQLKAWIDKQPGLLKKLIEDGPRGKLPSPADLPDAVAGARRAALEEAKKLVDDVDRDLDKEFRRATNDDRECWRSARDTARGISRAIHALAASSPAAASPPLDEQIKTALAEADALNKQLWKDARPTNMDQPCGPIAAAASTGRVEPSLPSDKEPNKPVDTPPADPT